MKAFEETMNFRHAYKFFDEYTKQGKFNLKNEQSEF